MKYLDVWVEDNNGEDLHLLIEVPKDKVQDTILTIFNKACLVVDAWGYGEYSDMYDRFKPLSTQTSINDGFSSVIDVILIEVGDDAIFDSVPAAEGMRQWDEFLLEGFDEYDPETEPFDMKEVLPTVGADKLEFED